MFVKSTGKVFSAGADLTWMKRTATYTREQNLADAMELGRMLNTLASLPVPTIALINGLAFGGVSRRVVRCGGCVWAGRG